APTGPSREPITHLRPLLPSILPALPLQNDEGAGVYDTRSSKTCRLAELSLESLEQHRVADPSALVVLQPIPLVGRVGTAAWHAPREVDRIHTKDVLEDARRRDRTARTGDVRLLPVELLEHLTRRDVDRIGAIQHEGLRGARNPLDLDLRARGAVLLDVLLDQLHDLDGILIGNEPAGHLQVSLARRHGLGALALETTPDSVHVERGARPHALNRRPAGLAPKLFE